MVKHHDQYQHMQKKPVKGTCFMPAQQVVGSPEELLGERQSTPMGNEELESIKIGMLGKLSSLNWRAL